MEKNHMIAYQGGQGEIVEKKSRFISTVFPIQSEEEAISYIEKTRKQYWDATHNCFAYVIGSNNEIQRCSDDGEPSGTAGRPMLDVLLGEEIHNILVIVTRYFGGTLLGTGGLVRAYSKSTQEGIANSVIITKLLGRYLLVKTDYNGIGKIQYIIGQMELHVMDTEYTDSVVLKLMVPQELVEEFEKKVIEATSARAVVEIGELVYYAILDKEVLLL